MSIEFEIENIKVATLDELIKSILAIKKIDEKNVHYFRGENNDFGDTALTPSIYRKYTKTEHRIYREMQRFNDHEFAVDKTAFDKLSRMQHYQAPTRMLDMSEDVMSALYFALDQCHCENHAVLYVLEIDHDAIKYYDSDAVSVVANLAKSPLTDGETKDKSKEALRRDARELLEDIEAFNVKRSVQFLLHDIKEERSYFESVIDPKHLFSVFCVKPKYTNQRIHGQKGAFLLFGLNMNDVGKPINLFCKSDDLRLTASLPSEYHPIRKLTKITLSCDITLKSLSKLGITTPYIYPELDKVAQYLCEVEQDAL